MKKDKNFLCCGSKRSKKKFPNTKKFKIKISFNENFNYYCFFDEMRFLITKNFPFSEIITENIISNEMIVVLNEKRIFEIIKNSKNQVLFKNSKKKNKFLNKILSEIL